MISIAFTGGGTGGHIYPGLALISYLQQHGGFRIFWIGSGTGMDRAIVEGAGIAFYGIPSGKLRRYFSFKNFADIFKVLAGFFAARRILKKEKPVLLFSKGGFVSVPPCAAAASLKIPVFSHESDSSPGLATRINLRFSEKVFIPYKESAALFPFSYRSRLQVSGNPIRPQFRGADPAKGRAFLGLGAEDRILLVLGGSQGAREINELVREALPDLVKIYAVVHQTGYYMEWDEKPTAKYKPYRYIGEELPHVIAAAEIVLCRSGAGTVWECASLQKPMILIPLSGSGTRGDQVENAEIFERMGAALVFRPGQANRQGLTEAAAALAGDREKRQAMIAASSRLASSDAASLIAASIADRAGQILVIS
ncbi:MAG: undecaprenyldiphospho-muramoylpentapeptide beta-N-acetylglucosaminyltransferase [Treponema sp.]|jgi:UDP-N-acetylglucosamine--N-acetylmuramyl-(pentapeptide) pyrophosphoryl-undecaprenol N-acetylglucosamine transferase|nr:undecaprenyldiphospho-muramoylpentapeptide beta-N-acetylglucosaminyltransferase [Treponema sp.]